MMMTIDRRMHFWFQATVMTSDDFIVSFVMTSNATEHAA